MGEGREKNNIKNGDQSLPPPILHALSAICTYSPLHIEGGNE